MFSIRVKELLEPRVTLGDFMVKNTKLGKGNLNLIENWFGRNKIWCGEDDQLYVSHYQIGEKRFLDSNFIKSNIIDKI